ncbi:MMPL family transporter [Occultella glacieicola]|uniref:MMPL family transporter n=1 Tax=Occultella glacieicola TaxID=2518684 RepID=A0ABY2DXQ1_9MICO|nr:MMPL family transporter [Occultella glacieicola]TDE88821.1 MMPL family transporter [Occultella glacieicola]
MQRTSTTNEPNSPGRSSRWLRILIPVLLVGAWLAAAAIGGPYFGRVDEVSTNDQTSFLPASADATKVADLRSEFAGAETIPAIVVYTSEAELTEAELTEIAGSTAELTEVPGVTGEVSPPVPSTDGLAVQVFLSIDPDADVPETVDALREEVRASVPDGVEVHVTGPAGFTADLVDAFGGIDGILLMVALGAVFVILVIVYRSPFLPLVVLTTSMSALCAALLTVWWLAKAGIVLLTGQTQGILFILVIGAATDYALLYVARYREALRRVPTAWGATKVALRGSVEPIVASGGTVIAALLCLLLSDLNSNKSLGPVAAIGIVFALLAALTLLPALLLLTGRGVFWPRRPVYDESIGDEDEVPTTGLWARLSRAIANRPNQIWIVTAVALLIACAFVPQLKASGVPSSDFVLTASDARDGQEALGEHFAGGSGTPALVVVDADDLEVAATTILENPGVDALTVVSADSPSGSAVVTADGVQPPGEGAPAPAPTEVDGRVLLQATLTDPPDSDAAEDTVRELRDALGDDALIGGETATAVDSNDASTRDRTLLIPLILAVIAVILMVLLRAILAPVLLVATVVLSFGASMGVSALVFNHVLGFPGADPAVPLFGFVFLVALGIDYNIFLMSRVREESLVHGTRSGILRGLSLTGGVITSAGVVLAATFAALAVIPILFLAQLAFIVAFGVLLDTIVVRSLLVPALSYSIGRSIWWPSALAKGAHAAERASESSERR